MCGSPADLLQDIHIFFVLGPRAGCSTPGGTPPAQSRGAECPPSPCCTPLCSPGHGWLSEPQAHIARSRPVFHSPAPSSPSWQGCLQSLPLQIIDTEGCSNSGQVPCTWACWPLWDSHVPPSWASPDPSGWYPILHVSVTPLSLVTMANLLRVHWSHCLYQWWRH